MKVNHIELKELIKAAYNKRLPLFIWGAIGIGKSTIARDVAKEIGGEKYSANYSDINSEDKFCFIDERISTLDPSDLRGLPKISDDSTKWISPEWLPKKGQGIIFFDELNLAPPSIQAAAYQLILDRRLGSYRLPDGYFILAAGNRLEDRANIFDLPAPLANRFIHAELLVPTIENWTKWAAENKVDARVIAFLNFRKSYIYKFDDTNSNKAYPTPRSWVYCSMLISGVKDNGLVEMFAGSAIGEGVGIEFTAFNKLAQKFDIKAVLENPDKAKLPDSIDEKYCMVSAIAEHYYEHKNTLPAIIRLCNKIEPEFAVLVVRICKDYDNAYFTKTTPGIKEFVEFSKKYGKYIIPGGS